MPDFINQDLLARRLRQMQLIPNPLAPIEEPEVAPQQVAVPQQVTTPQPRPFAPTETQERIRLLAESMPSLTEGEPGYRREFAHPGKLNRLAAILSGMSAGIREGGGAGAATARAIRLAPYKEALSEWEMKRKALEPLANIELQQAGLGQEQYRSDVSRFSAELRNMNAQELNDIRRGHEGTLDRLANDLIKYRGTDVERALQKEEARVQNEYGLIKARTAGQKEVTDIRETGAIGRAREGITARHEDVAAQQAGAMDRAKLREKGMAGRATGREALPYSKINMEAYERKMAEDLAKRKPEWAQFVDIAEKRAFRPDVSFKIKSVKEIPQDPVTQIEYKKFMRALDLLMRSEDYEYEDQGSGEDEEQ